MSRPSWSLVALAAAGVLGLAACDQRAEVNPNAPGSPGTGNAAEVVRPAAPDSLPGGSSGAAGSQPNPGSSGGDAVPGTTGQGPSMQPGSGLNGGLGTGSSASAMGSASAPAGGGTALQGTSNMTPDSTAGRRP